MTKCEHDWRITHHTGFDDGVATTAACTFERCRKCGKTRQRKATPKNGSPYRLEPESP